MEMFKVCLMSLEDDGKFWFLKEMELPRVPVIGDNIINEEANQHATVYSVVSVIFDKCGKTDVFVVGRGKLADYLRSLGSLVSTQYSK